MSKRRDRHARKEMRRLAARIYGQPLAITADKLAMIIDAFEDYRSGLRLSSAEARLRAGRLAAYDDEFDDDEDGEHCGYQIVNGVAVLSLSGTITQRPTLFQKYSGGTSCEGFTVAFDRAMADDRVVALLANTDTYGGEICGVDELSRHIFESRGQKPMYSIANSHMHSAGYYIGSAFDQVIVKPTGMVGSVGVVSAHYEQSKAEAVAGIKYTLIHAGKHKVDGNQHEPLSAQARKSIQEVVDDAYAMFTSAVARNRGISVDRVIKEYGEGKSFLGQSAVDAGLADRVATLEEIIAELGASKTTVPAPANAPPRTPMRSQSVQPPAGKPKEECTVDPRIKAALFARGLIAADATDAEATAALNAFCVARGVAKPTSVETTVELLMSHAAQPAAKPASKNGSRRRVKAEDDNSDEHRDEVDAEDDEDEDEEDDPETPHSRRTAKKLTVKVRAEEQTRILDIQARGRLLGVSEELIETAIEKGDTVGEALVRFTDAKTKDSSPVAKPSITPTGSSVDAFTEAASEAVAFRCLSTINQPECRMGQAYKPKPLSAKAEPFRFMRLMDIAAKAVQMSGVRTDSMDPDDIAKAFLKMGGDYSVRLDSSGSFARPGDYPNILSAVFGKVKEAMIESNTATFRLWCGQMESVPDFHPRTIISVGNSGELDYWPDGDKANDDKNAESVAWISTDRYGRTRSLTPVMIANDQLGMFLEIFLSDLRGHDLTLNRLAVDLLFANPTLPNGNAFFSSGNANIVDGANGGAPSIDQSSAVRLKMRQQTDIGGKTKIRLSPSIALVGAKWETAAEQVWLRPVEGVVPVTDATYNPFRGKIMPVVEQMLDDVTAAAGQVWFAFADPRVKAAVKYMYQTGFEGGKVESWWDPETKCRKTSVEGRFGVATNEYRAAVRNSGGNASY